MEGKRSGRTKALLVVLSVFVLGFAAGALSMNLYKTVSTRPARPPGEPKMSMIQRMDEKLDLTPEQSGQMKKILEETFDKYGEIKREIAPQFNSVKQQSRDRMRAVLTPEQLPKYEEMVQESDKRREKNDRDGWREKK